MLAKSKYARPVSVEGAKPYYSNNLRPSSLGFTRARVPVNAISRVRVPIHQSYVAYAPVVPGAPAKFS